MVTLSEEILGRIEVGGEVVEFAFRQPTNGELNKFLADRYPTDRKKGMRDNSPSARVAFFDLLLTGVKNLADSKGEITAERKDAIPANWKGSLIFQLFEDVQVVDEKN